MTNSNTTVCCGIFPSRLKWLFAKPLPSHGWGKQAVMGASLMKVQGCWEGKKKKIPFTFY